MREKKVTSLKIVFEDDSDYVAICEKGMDKDEVIEYIERAFRPEPAEPLIKDEKVRKAVRAWYKLFDESQLGQFKDGKYIAVGFREFVLQSLDESLTYMFELPFIDGMQTLKQRWGLDTDYYTIIELCGEEEE